MRNYLKNLYLWAEGWRHFDEITFKPGWEGTLNWKLLYATDYLACPLILGGPVVSVSYYLGKYWGVEGSHFANAGRPLWGSERSPAWVRVLIPVIWLCVLWWLV